MSKKNKRRNQDKIAAKKAAVLGTEKKSRLPLLVGVLGVILLAGAAAFYLTGNGPTATAPTSVAAGGGGTSVTFSAASFEDGKARYYEQTSGDLTIRYFIIKSSDGIIRAAFDACDVCWPAGKGYYQDGDDMVCRNCGRRFASVLVNEVEGGCNPAPLKRTVDKDKLVIQVKDILEGRTYFDLDRKV